MRLGRYTEIVLASTSSARRALMDSLGIGYRVEAPGVSEDFPAGIPVPHAVAMLAERKARAVASKYPQALVIGADQLVSVGGKILGKPADEKAASEQLSLLCGRMHEIWTGVSVVGPGFLVTEVDVAKLSVLPLAPNELQAYISTGEWHGCAGGYRVEARGQAIFSRIDGDRTAIQGLPMQRVVRMLREAGVRFFEVG